MYAIQSSGSGQPPIMTVNIATFTDRDEAERILARLIDVSPARRSYLSVVSI